MLRRHERAHLREAQSARGRPVAIDEAQPAPPYHQGGGERIVAEGRAAEMRHHAAELGAVGGRGEERYLRESQKAGGIRGGREGLDEGRLDKIEVGLGTGAVGIGWGGGPKWGVRFRRGGRGRGV